jgi:hypothetical protein
VVGPLDRDADVPPLGERLERALDLRIDYTIRIS